MDALTSPVARNVSLLDCTQDSSVTFNASATVPRHWHWHWQGSRLQLTSGQDLLNATFVDLAVLPGQVATPDAVCAVGERKRLLDLIACFQRYGFSQVAGRGGRVSAKAAAAACGFIKLLPYDAVMPRVAPDGEDGLVAVWDRPNGALLVVVDDTHLHIVANAMTPNARYYDQVPFQPDGMRLPAEVLTVLPRR